MCLGQDSEIGGCKRPWCGCGCRGMRAKQGVGLFCERNRHSAEGREARGRGAGNCRAHPPRRAMGHLRSTANGCEIAVAIGHVVSKTEILCRRQRVNPSTTESQYTGFLHCDRSRATSSNCYKLLFYRVDE